MSVSEHGDDLSEAEATADGPGACVLSEDGTILFHDEAFARLIGGGDLAGTALSTVVPAVVLDSGSVSEVLVAGRTLQLRATKLPMGGGPGWLCAVQDVTPTRRTKARLSVLGQTLRSLIEASPLAILTLDPDKNVDMWNPAAEQIFGWTHAEIHGRPYPIVAADRWIEFCQLFDRVMGGEGFTGVEARRERKDGTPLDLAISTAPLRDAEGRVTGAMALLEDLTAKKNLEQRYRHSQKMEAVGRLAGGVAHDFNNLLTVILGTCDLLTLSAGNDLDLATKLGTIRHCGARAAELTESLLAFSRRQDMQPQVLDLNALVQRVTPILQRLTGKKVQVEDRLEPDLPPIFADGGQIEQVLVNLVVNGKDAMPDGGRLLIETRSIRVATAGAVEPGSYVTVEVTDTGPGIPAQVLPHVFEPFFTTKGLGNGTGLGLATVHGIAHQSGGTVEVETTIGEGTRFRVLLPRAAQTAQVRSPDAPRPLAHGTETVLLVEDNASVRTTTAKMLESLGYRVLSAADGPTALDLCRARTSVDLLLTDVQLGGMGGHEVAQRFQRLRPGTPVALMSGHLAPDSVDVSSEAVDSDSPIFLAKPLRLNVLAAQIRATLDRRRRSAATRQGNNES